MADQAPKPVQPTESALALSFLREDIQDVRQDIRQVHGRIDDLRAEMGQRIEQTNERIDDLRTEMNGRIDDLRTEMNGRIEQTNEQINDLGKQLDSRYARLMAMLIACTSILVTALGAAVAVLK